MRDRAKDEEKKPSGFVRFMKFVFVKNIGYKLLALGLAVVSWLIIVALA